MFVGVKDGHRKSRDGTVLTDYVKFLFTGQVVSNIVLMNESFAFVWFLYQQCNANWSTATTVEYIASLFTS